MFIACWAIPWVSLPLPVAADSNELHIKVPVIAQNLPRGVMITGPPFQGLELQVRGPKTVLNTLPGRKLQYLLDLSTLKPGRHTVPLYIEQLHLPKGLIVENIQPRFIHVQLENEVTKEVDVAVFFKGNPATGYVISEIRAIPDSVLLRGPGRILDSVQNVSTHPIDVTGISESFKKQITLDLLENLEVITPRAPIKVEVTLAEEILTRRFCGIPIRGNDPQRRCEITPSLVAIDVKGPLKQLETLTSAKDFNVYIDIKDLGPGIYVRRATIELPVNTALLRVLPEIFTVKIRE